MKKKVSLLIVALAIPVLLAAQGDVTNPIIQYSPARDGGVVYDPLQSDAQFMSLRGQVRQIIQKRNVESDMFVMMNPSDTLRFDRKGRLLSICSAKKDPYSPQVKFPPTRSIYRYQGEHCSGYTFEEWSENASSNRPLMKRVITSFEYDQRGRLWKEWEKVYFEEPDGKIREALEGFTKDPQFILEYDAEGHPISALFSRGGSKLRAKYNAQGKLTQISDEEPGSKPIEYSYDTQGRLTGIKSFMIDGMDEVENYEKNTTITYNAQGDMIKISAATWLCNTKWVRIRRLYTNTTLVTYTYDQQGNWIRAAIKEQENGRVTPRGAIERQITYWTGSDTSSDADNNIHDIVDEMPTFSGGANNMVKYLSENLQYPEQAKATKISGKVLVNFVVEKDGSISNCKVVKSVSPELDNEALRAVSSMPAWIPGKKEGQPVRVRYTIPINFAPQPAANTTSTP